MVQAWRFPRARYLFMQLALWVILGGTLGLAELLDFHLRKQMYTPLAGVIVEGPVSFRFPDGWKETGRSTRSGVMSQTAIEPPAVGGGGAGRQFTVLTQRVGRLMPPVEYLLLSGALPKGLDLTHSPEPINIAGWPGQLVQISDSDITPDGHLNIHQQDEIACAIMPDRIAVTVRLDKPGPIDAADQRLLIEILQNMQTVGPEHPVSGAAIQMPNGTTISVPPDFVVYPESDPLRNDRTLICQTGGGWVSAELFPACLPEGEPADTFLPALAAREQFLMPTAANTEKWLEAKINPEGPNTWRIDPQDPPDGGIHRRAYFLNSETGEGLLAVLTAITPSDEEDLDVTWSALVGQIHLGHTLDLHLMLLSGHTLATNPLPEEPTTDRWFLWTRHDVPEGWTHCQALPHQKIMVRATVMRNWIGGVMQVAQSWNPPDPDPDTGQWMRVERSDSDPDLASRPVLFFRETTTLGDGVTTSLSNWFGNLPPTTVVKHPAFVLSSAWPGALAAVPDTSLAFWTDRFPGSEGDLWPRPVLLLVHRVDDTDPDKKCVQVEVNGTGQDSQWYFNSDGSFKYAEFPGGLILRPSNVREVEVSFAGDPRLTPLNQ